MHRLCRFFAFILVLMVMSAAFSGCAGGAPGADADALAPQFTLPGGFEPGGRQDNLYLSPDYPDDASCIYWTTLEPDPYFESYTPEILAAALSASLSAQLGQEIPVEVENLVYFTVQGFSAYRMEAVYATGGVAVRQLIVCINGAALYQFTYTQAGAADWMEDFYTSAATICLPETGA